LQDVEVNERQWCRVCATVGAASKNFPDNMFIQVLPLSRMQDLAFRREFFGFEAIVNGSINSPVIENWPGIRFLYEQVQSSAPNSGLE
jgi:hypothetical protein